MIYYCKTQENLIKLLREKNTKLVKDLHTGIFSFESGGNVNSRTAKALLEFKNLIRLSEGEASKFELTEQGKTIEL